ncbi:MAG: relaxase/mobilization nuclease domain-containing protein, partial [Synergistaceae bacterium]|nr:relaxase/mobilization nuclease domain-containing protein [Synergistaceae bacterium]
MIGKYIPSPKSGGSFGGLNDYISGKSKRRIEGEKGAFADCVNLISVDTATAEMEAIAFQNKRCGNPVMHLLLSWREDETPEREQVLEAVRITLDEMNLSQCQAVYALHQNTDNMHLHICVNRVDPDTLKAINPAHGWTRKGMERAARRIEHAQGWEVENNAWSEIDGQGRIVQKERVPEAVIPQPVKDKENLTGEQSAVRKAQGALKDAAKGLKSWREFHALARSNGMEYEKKGSGAIIRVGDIVIKASAASRNLGLSKLEKIFGEYEPAIDVENIGKSLPQGNDKLISEPKPLDRKNDNDLWKAYITERNGYLRNKKEVRRQISQEHDEQKREMKQRHASERKAMYAAYSGRPRKEIYEQRKILATKHAYETVLLKEAQKNERDDFHKFNPGFTATYEQWLRDRGLDGEAEAWRHRKDENYFRLEISGEGKPKGDTDIKGLPGFKAAAGWRGTT